MADNKKTLGQRVMSALTKDYKYTVYTPEGREERDQTEKSSTETRRSLNPRKDAEIDVAADEGTTRRYRKGGAIRGCGCAVKGKTKGTMR